MINIHVPVSDMAC